jgi:hypothetical protein
MVRPPPTVRCALWPGVERGADPRGRLISIYIRAMLRAGSCPGAFC